ncbi:hypothetical protein CEXT_164581 [Caerostris extrusa]|uniref:Uncharacterized protein n=1 Tax=Caerostris extrusa TaxID=172846 RepID=A0AAV4SFK7_CAEEX|nr:hypothetical protein CEXT_164581 [Caerostris extrusa]
MRKFQTSKARFCSFLGNKKKVPTYLETQKGRPMCSDARDTDPGSPRGLVSLKKRPHPKTLTPSCITLSATQLGGMR